MKWKMILVAGLGATAFGFNKNNNIKINLLYLLCLIPFICAYVDSLCRNIFIRILIIGKYLSGTDSSYAKYEKFACEMRRSKVSFWGKPVTAFAYEILPLTMSSIILNSLLIIVPCYIPQMCEGLPYRNIIIYSGMLGIIIVLFMEFSYRIKLGIINDELYNWTETKKFIKQNWFVLIIPLILIMGIIVIWFSLPLDKKHKDDKVFVIPFLEEGNKCSIETDNSPCEKNLSCKEGANIDETTQKFIYQLTKALLSCSNNGKSVKIEIKGFSSSSKFPEEKNKNSNFVFANKRAVAVKEAIEKAEKEIKEKYDCLLPMKIEIETIKWQTNAQMVKARGFNDLDRSQYYNECKGFFNRRVEIVVKDPAGCKIVNSVD